MDKYDKLMQDLIEFLKETDLGRRVGRDPIRGSTDAEIEAVEQEIGKQLPAALRAWYRVAGSVPPYSGDSETEPSLSNLQYAQTIAADVTKYEPCELKLESHILPFSQRYQSEILFVNMKEGNPDNPPVYYYEGCGGQPDQVAKSFTTLMRNAWTSPLITSAVYDEIRHKIYARFDRETD